MPSSSSRLSSGLSCAAAVACSRLGGSHPSPFAAADDDDADDDDDDDDDDPLCVVVPRAASPRAARTMRSPSVSLSSILGEARAVGLMGTKAQLSRIWRGGN